MISIAIKDTQLKGIVDRLGKKAMRAAETALDATVVVISAAEKEEMKRVFDNPVAYTLNSVKVTKTKGHNMLASVAIRNPPRMQQSYLSPEVLGGPRKLKGFELGIEKVELIPGKASKLNQYGNIAVAAIKKMKAGLKKGGDFIFLPKGNGQLPPGIYQRVVVGKKATLKSRRAAGVTGTKWQRGSVNGVITPRGLAPIMLVGRTGHSVKPRLDFFGVAQRMFDSSFSRTFADRLRSSYP